VPPTVTQIENVTYDWDDIDEYETGRREYQ
jgi:hypothetical protein